MAVDTEPGRGTEIEPMKPDLERARRTAEMAHTVVARLKEAGLPDELDAELASLSTDLGDLWGAQRELEDRLEGLFGSLEDWGAVGDSLVDLRATVDHIGWHARRARRPARALARFAYGKASKAERAAAGYGKTNE